MSASVVVDAPCKVNLDLTVLGRRTDGFHELDTVLVALDHCDRLSVTLREERAVGVPIHLEVRGDSATSDIPLGPENLVWRAAERMLALDAVASSTRRRSVELLLEKNIPSRAGLGGGSSDAAACVFGLATLFGWSPEDPRSRAVLSDLGSDCLFFLEAGKGGWARCTGRGEIVQPLEPPEETPAWVAVLTPECECSTSRAYGALDARPFDARSLDGGVPDPDSQESGEPATVAALRRGALDSARAALRNDLEQPALATHPELRAWHAVLRVSEPRIRLAGSGSSWFALHPGVEAAQEGLERLVDAGKRVGLATRAAFVAALRPRGVALVGEPSSGA